MAIAGPLLLTVFGGIITGGAVAGAVLLLAGRTEDHRVELTLPMIAAYGSFFAAERFHMSGVLASLTAGIVIRNVGWRRSMSASGHQHILSFWEYAAFLANSTVFILIGVQTPHQDIIHLAVASATAIALVLLGRALAVYPLCAMFSRSSMKVDSRYQRVLVWGGLRGAVALALALTLPEHVPERGEVIVLAFAVVAFSIFVQGLTMPPWIRRLGLVEHIDFPVSGSR